jgi:hypothetical protein
VQDLSLPNDSRQSSDAPQRRETKSRRGPRATAVVEFLPGGGMRLAPVALWIDGRFYDASLYGADPEPMALEPETMYQALSYGEPTGWFVVSTPHQLNGSWIAEGHWKAQGSLDTKVAERAAKQRKQKQLASPMNDDEGPPVLRRSGESGLSPKPAASSRRSSPPPSPSSSPGPKPQDEDHDRPTLKKSPSSSSGSSESSGPPAQPNGSSASSATPAGTPAQTTSTGSTPPPASSPDEDDPNRPILRRGRPTVQPGNPLSAATAPKPGEQPRPNAPAPPFVAASTQALPTYPAISDAGSYETRSMLYAMTPAEKEDKARQLLPLAAEEIRNFISKRPGSSPAVGTTPITSYDVRAFDLDFSNSPTLVLTAKLPALGASAAGGGGRRSPRSAASARVGVPEFDYFVTVVARLDLNGQPVKIFGSVTDTNHLDAFPRLQIIDAVDADGNGRGELLFRQYSDTGVSYSLYRVFPYQMVKVFEGGAGV